MLSGVKCSHIILSPQGTPSCCLKHRRRQVTLNGQDWVAAPGSLRVTDRAAPAEPPAHDTEAHAARQREAERRRDLRIAERAAATLRASTLPAGLASRLAASSAEDPPSAGGMAGIGVRLGRNGFGEHVVEWVRPGSSAERKLRAGDVVAGVTEVPARLVKCSRALVVKSNPHR